MAQNAPSVTKQPKIRTTFKVLLVIVALVVALLLAFGAGGQLMGDYNKRFWIASTQGTASSNEIDPHIAKTQLEYNEVIAAQRNNQVDGIFEQISAGDYEYPSITDESLGQHTINSFFFYEDKTKGEKGFESAVQTLESLGYKQDPELEATPTNASLVRNFIPADENSEASPGPDKVSLSVFTRESGTTVIVFLFQSTELPLNGIPKNGEEYTVQKLKDYQNQVNKGEVDSCTLTPNGAVGGWYPDLGCFKEDL